MPGVAAAIGLTAILLQPVANALHFVDGFTFAHALVFAALIAATDPIAVVALFRAWAPEAPGDPGRRREPYLTIAPPLSFSR